MKPVRPQFAVLVVAFSVLCFPNEAAGQDEDLQFWILTSASGHLDEDTSLTIDATYRVREDVRGGDERTLRFLVEQDVTEFAKIGGGLGVFEAAGGKTQIRVTQQVAIRAGRFDSRTRVEERFFDSAEQVELRFRQRLRFRQPVSQDINLALSLEWLHLLQPRSRNTQYRDELRPQVGFAYNVHDNISLGVNYLAIISPRGMQRDRINHIPQASIDWKF